MKKYVVELANASNATIQANRFALENCALVFYAGKVAVAAFRSWVSVKEEK